MKAKNRFFKESVCVSPRIVFIIPKIMLTFELVAGCMKYLSEKEKTLVLLSAGFPYGTGETFLAPELEYLAREFTTVWMVVPETGGPARPVPSNVKIIPLPPPAGKIQVFGQLFSVRFWKEMANARRMGQPLSWAVAKIALRYLADAEHWAGWLSERFPENNAVVFYSYWCDAKTLALALLKERRPQTRCLTRLHGWDVYRERHTPPYLPFRRYMAEQLDASVFISENGRTYFRKTWKPEYPERLRLFRLGTPDPLPPGGERRLHLFSCSALIPLKRVGLIAEAVLQFGGRISWTHLGNGPLMADLKKQIAGAEAYISLPGNVSNEMVHRRFAQRPGSIFINLSETEGLPVSVMEAMSYGFPAIATDVGGTREIVRNGYNGILLPPSPSLAEVTDALTRLWEMDESSRQEMEQNARHTWATDYSADKNFTEFARFLAGLTA